MVQMPVKFLELRPQTDLKQPPSNWLHGHSKWESYMQRASLSTDNPFSRFVLQKGCKTNVCSVVAPVCICLCFELLSCIQDISCRMPLINFLLIYIQVEKSTYIKYIIYNNKIITHGNEGRWKCCAYKSLTNHFPQHDQKSELIKNYIKQHGNTSFRMQSHPLIQEYENNTSGKNFSTALPSIVVVKRGNGIHMQSWTSITWLIIYWIVDVHGTNSSMLWPQVASDDNVMMMMTVLVK